MQHHDRFQREGVYPRHVQMDFLPEAQKGALWQQLNPHQILLELLPYGKILEERNPDQRYDLTDEKQAKRFVKEIKLFLQLYGHKFFDEFRKTTGIR